MYENMNEHESTWIEPCVSVYVCYLDILFEFLSANFSSIKFTAQKIISMNGLDESFSFEFFTFSFSYTIFCSV